MNAAEKDFILRGWNEMSNEAIVKDVATKGKYINLAIGYLAKRLNAATVQETKTFFRIEVNKYVERLLANKQVFKAERVLSNVNVNAKLYFYEFYESCDDSEVRGVIINYLKKVLGDEYEREHLQMTTELKALKMVKCDEALRTKYPDAISLEQFKGLDVQIQKELLSEVCFTYKCDLVVEELDKHVTWKYLLDRKLFVFLSQWIESLENPPGNLDGLGITFENILKNKFSKWDLDDEMISLVKIHESHLPDYVLNSLARRSIFMENELENVDLLVQRLTSSGSMTANIQMLKSRPYSLKIIKSILDRNLHQFLIEDFVEVNDLIEIAPQYPQYQDEIELCVDLKKVELSNTAAISSMISKYLKKKNPDFDKEHPLVNLVEIFLQKNASIDALSPDEFKEIPLLKTILQKFQSSGDRNDFHVTLQDLVKRFESVDLNSIKADAGGEELNFSNPSMFEKHCHGKVAKLGYIYYIKQYRSSYAVYVFLMDQLSSFSKISDSQIMCACVTVAELAISNFEDVELVTHCFAFMEMLDVNTMFLRAYLKCFRWIKKSSGKITVEGELVTTSLLERVVLEKLQSNDLHFRDLDAVRMVFEMKKEKLPTSILAQIATTRGWFQMLGFATYLNYTLDQVLEVCDQSFGGTILGANLKRALRWEIPAEKTKRSNSSTASYREKRKSANKNEIMVTSGETMSSSISSNETLQKMKQSSSRFLAEEADLFATIIQSTVDVSTVGDDTLTLEKFYELWKNPNQIQSTTQLNLLRNAFRFQRPILAVLAAMSSQSNAQYCWATWMITAVDSYELPDELIDLQQLSKSLIEFSVAEGFVRTLSNGMAIFFPDGNFNIFVDFLVKTKSLDFSTDTSELLEKYFLILSNDDVEVFCLQKDNVEILNFSITLLVKHLQFGFESKEYQRLMLVLLCESTIERNHIIDFRFISDINAVLTFSGVEMNIMSFMKDRSSAEDMKKECERICDQLVLNHEFAKAIQAADLFELPKDSIIYESWLSTYENDETFDLDRYDIESDQYSLSPEIVINFYIHVASRLDYSSPKKYKILKKILEVIKRHHLFPNESFDRDRIEYEMVLSFLKNPLTVQDIELYYSEYYETIMSKERFVLYKSFLDLKEMAGIEELTVTHKSPMVETEVEKLNSLMNRLLDDGDIVEALRIQAMFNHRPIDLHYLVFCMALAEGLASLYDLTAEQRKMLSDGVKSASSKFNRRTLTRTRLSHVSPSPSPSSKRTGLDTSDTSTVCDFEEIPSRERCDVLEALQSLAARINHGTKIGHRIAMTCRAAMYLDKDYVDVLKIKDPFLLLHSAINEDCLNKLIVMNDIMASMEMTHAEIADFLAEKISGSIIMSRFYLLQTPPNLMAFGQSMLWGYDLDKEFRLFLELCPNTSMLGNAILQYSDTLKLYRRIDLNELSENDIVDAEFFDGVKVMLEKIRVIIGLKGLSHKKQNTIVVELLIKAHECFVHECYMEGIANVLQRAKSLNSILTKARSWNLIVKLLTGIGRYRDMYYCFETLVKNEQFESLLGQFDDDKSIGLKQAIISYLNEHCPDNTEYFRLAAVHFSIYKELSLMSETKAKSVIAKVITTYEEKNDDSNMRSPDEASVTYLKCNQVISTSLTIAMEEFSNAAENYLLDNKLNLAQRAAYNAELVALQIDLNNREVEKSNERCICVLNIRSGNVFRSIVNNSLSVPQSIILSHAYPYEINWTEAIFNQYILMSNETFLMDFCDRHSLTDEMIENLVKNFQLQTNVTAKMEQHISKLVEMVQSVTVRYRLASLLGLKRLVAQLINENSLFYLKDTNYGRNEQGT